MKFSSVSVVNLIILKILLTNVNYIYTVSVAIIGSGLGGSGVSYYLNNLQLKDSKGKKLKIYLYEQTCRIGGRSHSIKFQGKDYEVGRYFIHTRNVLANEIVEKLGLSKRQSRYYHRELPKTKLGIFDSQVCTIKEEDNILFTVFNFIAHYGFNLFTFHQLVSTKLDQIDRIYSKMNERAFRSVRELLSVIDDSILNMTDMTTYDYFNSFSIEETIINELANAATLFYYGQDVNKVHALAGVIALTGIDITGNVWTVDGGIEKLALKMAEASEASIILNTAIDKVYTNQNESYSLVDAHGGQRTVDAVIIAHPLATSGLLFYQASKFAKDNILAEKKKKYTHLVTTLVSGERKLVDSFCSTMDLIVCKEDYLFHSISFTLPVDSLVHDTCSNFSCLAYKLVSKDEISNELLGYLFNQVEEVQSFPSDSCPSYNVDQISLGQGARFKLQDGLYYVNAIEWAASSIEMTLIGAKNVASLVERHLRTKKLVV